MRVLSISLVAMACASASGQQIEWQPVNLTGPSGKKITAERGLLSVRGRQRVVPRTVR